MRKKKTNRHLIRTVLMALTVPVTAFAAAAGLALVGIPVTGMDFDSPVKTSVGKKSVEKPYQVVSTQTNAYLAISNTFNTVDKNWKKQGSRIDAAGLPHPLSCVNPAPSLSVSQLYDIPRLGSAQVTITSYGAGVGAEAFKRIVTKAGSCQNNVSLLSVDQSVVGAESHRFQANWFNNNVTTVMWRYGDVVAYVATETKNAGNATAIARKIGEVLVPNLTACFNTESVSRDAKRNAYFAGKYFTGRLSTKTVETEKLEAPALTEQQIEAKVTKTDRGEELTLPDVLRPLLPTYPVWPELPNTLNPPNFPKAPAAQELSKTTGVRVSDPTGPGCGWAFMSNSVAPFDAARVAETNGSRILKAQTALDADGARWQKQVSAYWTAYANYVKKGKNYQEYAKSVRSVVKAWNAIAVDWQTYYTDHANWQIKEDARVQFLTDRKVAADEYNEAISTCDDLYASDDPDDTLEYNATCPPERPSILDEKPAVPEAEPVQPKDPRP